MRNLAQTLARALALILALTLTAPSPLSVTPANASYFNFGIKEEKELGDKFNVLIRSKLPMIEDSEVVDYARDVVDRLARQMPPQPFPFSVAVVQDNAINAFAAPGGYVFVFTGLMLNMNHDSEVAGVLAHELAHVTQRHIAKRVEQGRILSIASILCLSASAKSSRAFVFSIMEVMSRAILSSLPFLPEKSLAFRLPDDISFRKLESSLAEYDIWLI